MKKIRAVEAKPREDIGKARGTAKHRLYARQQSAIAFRVICR